MKCWIFEDMRLKQVGPMEYIRWVKSHPDRHIDSTNVGNVRISTVFLGGVSLDSDVESPRLFETLILGGSLDEYAWRYHTLGEAKEGHINVVEAVKQLSKNCERVDYPPPKGEKNG